MSNELPYFPFCPADFLLDEKVEAMTPAQVGCYMLLLCRSWISSEPGYISSDDTKLARLARVDRHDWELIKPHVLACFKTDATGRMYQPRLLAEYQKALEAHEARVKGGKVKSARARMKSSNAPATLQHETSTCSAHAQQEVSTCSPSGNRTEQNRTEQNKGLDAREQPAQPSPVQSSPVEIIRLQPTQAQGELEQALARWKGTGGNGLSLSEWEIFRRMLKGFGEHLNIGGQDQPVYTVAARAASEAIKQQAGFGTAAGAAKYIAAILERCRRDGVWPGEFAEREQKEKRPKKTLQDELEEQRIRIGREMGLIPAENAPESTG